MATVSYSVSNQVPEFITTHSAFPQPSDQTSPAVLALADGGFAVAFAWHNLEAPSDYSVLMDLYNSDGTARGATIFADTFLGNTLVQEPALTQLTNGNILVTFTDANDPGIHYAIVDPATGTVLTPDTKLTGTDAADVDSRVVALAGGAWAIVKQDTALGTDQDADIIFYSSSGTPTQFVALGDDSISNERQPVVAVLNNGNLAAAFEKEISDGSGTYGLSVQIFDPTGGAVLAPFAFDTSGTQNLNPAILALNDGGFAVAYEDNEYGEAGLTIAFFDQDGGLAGKTRVDIGTNADRTPSLSLLPNGFVAVTYADEVIGIDHDIMLAVFNPGDMTRVSDPFRIEGQSGIQRDSSVATLIDGTLVTAWTDLNSAIADGNTDPDDAHVSIQLDRIVRTWVLNNAGEIVFGDALDDSMIGGDGNDSMTPSGGRDSLYGGAGGDDILVGEGGVAAGEIFDGGDDFDYITVFGTGSTMLDFRGATVAAVEQLYFGNMNGGGATLRFKAAQFAFESVAYETQITGARIVALDMDTAAALDLSGLSLQGSPAAGDHFQILGDDDAESITGTTIADRIEGNAGNDTLDGGGGVDTLSGGGDDDDLGTVSLATGLDVLDGGTGTDRAAFEDAVGVVVDLAGGTYQFVSSGTGAALVGIEQVTTTGGNDTIFGSAETFSIDAGDGNDIVEVTSFGTSADGGSGSEDRLVLTAFAIDLTIDLATSAALTGFEDLTLGFGNDTASGTGGSNVLDGGGGNDSLSGQGERDTLLGGDNDDTLIGGLGRDSLLGEAGNDDFGTITAADGFDDIEGGSGSDRVSFAGTTTGIDVNSTPDTYDVGGVSYTFLGIEVVTTGSGDDFIFATATMTRIDGGGGNDFIELRTLATVAIGGSGVDGLDLGFIAGPLNFDLGTATQQTGFENLFLGADNDTGTGTGAANQIQGRDGHDVLSGLGGVDTLFGSVGNDTLDGGSGNDTMSGGEGGDTFIVASKNDVVIETVAGVPGGADTVNSGASSFTLGANIEDLTLTGTNNSEGIGNTLANRITGNTGNNGLQGLDSNDTLSGGDGDDDLRGGTGADRMTGGNGSDRFFVDDAGDQTIESNASLATGGIDTVFSTISRTLAANIENLRLQGTGDLNGNGNGLANKIFGTDGINLLKGFAGADTIQAKNGNDTIDGGEGNDTISGGGGLDVYRFASVNAGVDTITDFSRNFDKFDLSGGSFTAVTIAPNGDAVLTHNGGAIRIANPPNLTLAQWNALVLPSGGKAAPDPLATPDGAGHSAFMFEAGAGHTGLVLRNDVVTLAHGDFIYA